MSAAAEVDVDAEVAAARAAVLEQRAILKQWEARLVDTQVRLAELQDTAGDELLDNPDSGAAVAREIVELREYAAVTEKAIAAQEPRIVAAERTYLEAEARALEITVEMAKTTLTTHRKKVARLIEQLETLDGPYVPEIELLRLTHDLGADPGNSRSWRSPVSDHLARDLQIAERRVIVVREMAAGQDPRKLIQQWDFADGSSLQPDRLRYYPACVWQPDALVPAPALAGQRDRAQRWVEELQQLAIDLPARIDELRGQIHTTPHTQVDDDLRLRSLIARAEARLKTLPAEIEAAAARVAALAGDDETGLKDLAPQELEPIGS